MSKDGFFVIARKMLDEHSWLMSKPPLYLKLWIWMLCKANWKDRDKLRRGQFVTSGPEMREAMSYKVGARIERPSAKEIRRAYEGFLKGSMIGVTKSTRGMIITILNYDKYQDFHNYEGRDEGRDEGRAKGIGGAQDTELKELKELKTPRGEFLDMRELNNLAINSLGWPIHMSNGRREVLRPLTMLKREDVERGFAVAAQNGKTSLAYVIAVASKPMMEAKSKTSTGSYYQDYECK